MTPEQALARGKLKDPTCDTFVVRLYDGFDNEWMDVTGPLSAEEAKAEWAKRTNNGTEKTRYNDIDYFAIYPTSTRMRFS